MRLLVTGAGGMLGQEVVVAAERAGHEVEACDRARLDVTDRDAVLDAIAGARPHAVINCAAWTDVDGAEARESEATEINGAGAGHVAAAASAAGARLVQVSTDYVFDGTKGEPYVESDPPGARSAYGRSKLVGERAVAEAAPEDHLIVRTAWLFGPHGRNFVATMLGLARDRDEVTVVDDQVGCPTYASHLAGALVELAGARVQGIAHVAGGGSCSWYEFALETFRQAELDCEVRRGRTSDLARPAPRPACSILVSTRPEVPVLPPWSEGLADYLARQGVSS